MANGVFDRVKSWLGLKPKTEDGHERAVELQEFNGLLARFRRLSQKLDLPETPGLMLRDNAAPNANYRPSQNIVRINTGSLQLLSEREQDSELAHELGHAKDWQEHARRQSMREREFRADAFAVQTTGDVDARISGLKKIEDAAEHNHTAMHDKIANRIGPNAARLYASLPEFAQELIQESHFHGKNLLRRLHLARHPLAEERYQRLEAMKERAPAPGPER